MGRGRAKAKQQKVARELKYSSQSPDLDALQRELGAPGTRGGSSYLDEDDADRDEDDRDDWAPAR
jgi:hypothetical protein